ncbi:hemogen [Phyllostomus hastatus]|uniref:hemogen n=1 Tax=Phyllostomus hastatus TaxID=9423 RepID=UPI001E67E1EA|nr:hemogen [Phyllostomus hastatus]XP_045695944.1 hemogen [Phyllostomus hastatus]
MDLGKNRSHLTPRQTSDLHQEENHVPDVIGTWNLRNREQLRKRKAEAQEKQTSQWHFGERRHKRQRTGKGNQRGRKRQHDTELRVEPQSQLEKEMTERALAPAEKENELPRSVTEALCLVASPQRVVPEKTFSATGQESMIDQENSSECQETTVQNHPSEIGQEEAEPGDFSPKMCQEIAVIQDHSSKMCHDVAEPKDLSPKMCQETAVLQDHSPKMCHDMAEPEDLSPKMCQETSVATALPSKTYEDRADMEGHSLEAYPEPDVPKGYALVLYQKKAEPKEDTAEPGQGRAGTESFFPKTQQEIAVPKNLPAKIYHETVEPEQYSHKAYPKEIAVPKALSHKTIQEMAAPEECPSDTCIHQDTPGPEDLSTKTCKNKECVPEANQEAGGPRGQHPKAQQEDVKDVFPSEMKGQPKAQEPEIPSIPNLPREIHPENDVYSYVLF